MTRLFGREVLVRVADRSASGVGPPEPGRGLELLVSGAAPLDVRFHARRELLPQTPNVAKVEIRGLNEDSRGAIDSSVGGPFVLEAGYAKTRAQIFTGRVDRAWSERTASGWVSKIEASEGKAERGKRLSRSYGPGTQVSDVFDDLVKTMGLAGRSAAAKLRETRSLGDALDTFASGFVASGPAGKLMTELLSARGLEWTIVDDEVVVTEQGKPFGLDVVVLGPTTGLVEAPARHHDEQRPKGSFVKARSLLQPELLPGRRVDLESEGIEGRFKVLWVEHSGGTYGQEFYSDFVGEAIT